MSDTSRRDVITTLGGAMLSGLTTGCLAPTNGQQGGPSTNFGHTDGPGSDADPSVSSSSPDNGSPEQSDPTTTESGYVAISLDAPDFVFEGGVKHLTVHLDNQSDTPRSEQVTIQRGSTETIFSDQVVLNPNESRSLDVRWFIRNDAAGHTMELSATTQADSATKLVQGRPQFSPKIQEAVHTDDGIHLRYSIHNEGTSPDSHHITVSLEGVSEPIHTTDQTLLIDDSETSFLSIGQSQLPTGVDPVNITVATESSEVTQSVSL